MYSLVVMGGAGSGKSEAGRFFGELGAQVIDLDEVAKEMLEPGGPAYEETIRVFGPGILGQDGRISVGALAHEAFASREATDRLNAIVHPPTTEEVRRRLHRLEQAERGQRVVVLEIPLPERVPELLEQADHVLALISDPRVRLARLVQRGMDETDALRRLARQGTDEERQALADTVIRNDAGTEELRKQLREFWEREVEPSAS